MTDPAALAAIMGRGPGAMDKAALAYAPINKMCDPHGNANLLTSAADDSWKAVRKAVAVSFSMQVRASQRAAAASSGRGSNSRALLASRLRCSLTPCAVLARLRSELQNIRKKFPLVRSRINQLVDRLAALGPDASVDVDQAALRVTLDIIGLAGFGHDYNSVAQDTPAYDHLLRVLPRCFTETMLRIVNPLRELAPGAFKYGPKGE